MLSCMCGGMVKAHCLCGTSASTSVAGSAVRRLPGPVLDNLLQILLECVFVKQPRLVEITMNGPLPGAVVVKSRIFPGRRVSQRESIEIADPGPEILLSPETKTQDDRETPRCTRSLDRSPWIHARRHSQTQETSPPKESRAYHDWLPQRIAGCLRGCSSGGDSYGAGEKRGNGSPVLYFPFVFPKTIHQMLE